MARRTTATAAADRRASDRDLMRYWPEVFGSGSFGPFPPEFAHPQWLPEFPGSGGGGPPSGSSVSWAAVIGAETSATLRSSRGVTMGAAAGGADVGVVSSGGMTGSVTGAVNWPLDGRGAGRCEACRRCFVRVTTTCAYGRDQVGQATGAGRPGFAAAFATGGRATGWFLNAGTAVAMRATEAAPTRAFATTPLEKTDFKAGHGRPRPAIRRASRRQLCRWSVRLRRPRINRRSTTLFETPRSSATSL